MQKVFIGALLCASFAASSVMAGALSDTIVEEPVIVAETTGSSSGTATVLLLALLFSLAYTD